MMLQRLWLLVLVLGYCQTDVADEPSTTFQTVVKSEPLLGFTELQTNLPGGRHANIRTMRAVITQADGSNRRLIGQELITDENTWTQFAGWSPDGRQAIVARGWQDPANAAWEEEHRSFRMEPGKWLLDAFLIDIDSGN